MQVHPSFQRLIDTIARQLYGDKKFVDQLAIINCDVDLWPECEAKELAKGYLNARKSGTHENALIALWDRAEALLSYPMPDDPLVLRELYHEAFKRFQVDILREQLLKDPLNAESHIAKFNLVHKTVDLTHLGLDFDRIVERRKALITAGKSNVKVPGFEGLSQMIGGFGPARVTMLVAQTGFGKTTCAINLAYRAAEVFPVLYINMEMSEQDFGERLLCAVGGISMREYECIIMQDPEAIERLRSKVFPLPLHFSRGQTLKLGDIYSQALDYKRRYGLGMLVIDYDQKLQVATSKETPEWKALQQAIEGLDELSKTLECFILVLAQESSDGDVSGSKRSKFPASTVLRFFKDEDSLTKQKKFIIRALKNRFGEPNQEIEVSYEGARFAIKEIGSVQTREPVGKGAPRKHFTPPHTFRRDAYGD